MLCSGKETICEDACSYNCIQTVAANGRHHFQIDEQFCVDCGACAVACPEKAIVYAGAYNPMTLVALGQAIRLRPSAKHPLSI